MRKFSIKSLLLLCLCFHLLNTVSGIALSRGVEKKQETSIDRSRCDLVLTFGSYGSGVDSKTMANVLDYVEKSKDIKSHESWSAGREGDTSYCLILVAGSTEKVVREIQAITPKTSKKGWTSLSRKDGTQIFQTTWPK